MTDQIPVTPDMIETLLAHRDRSGVGVGRLLRGRRDRPAGLTSSTLHRILNTGCRTVRRDHYAYVLALYEQADDRIEITPEILETIKSEVVRTGKSVNAVMRNAQGAPEGFSAAKARHIYYGEIGNAFRGEIDFLLSQYRALPDKPAPQADPPSQDHAEGRVATRILPLAIPAELFDHLTSAFPLMGCASRIEYLRHLVRQDHLSPHPNAAFAPWAEGAAKAQRGRSLNFSMPDRMQGWIEDRAKRMKLAPSAYICALITLDRNNFR